MTEDGLTAAGMCVENSAGFHETIKPLEDQVNWSAGFGEVVA